jgi:putative phosphoribosyl transferase
VVVFAHGSGSSRFSPRNRFVAEGLAMAGLGTVLLDLLSPQEDVAVQQGHRWRFDIALLAERLTGAVDWIIRERVVEAKARVGLFGASTGAAAALITATMRTEAIGAVVCRGGRPDLAPRALPQVHCPTLLIVGGDDREVLDLNTQAIKAMTAPRCLAVVPGATHLFAEAGALEQVTALAKEWFCQYLETPGALPLSAPEQALPS